MLPLATDITVGGMVSLGAGTSISSPGTNVLTFGTNSTEKSIRYEIAVDDVMTLPLLSMRMVDGTYTMLSECKTDSSGNNNSFTIELIELQEYY